MSAAHTVPHTRILLGLVLGAALGCTAKALVENGAIPGEPVAAVVKYVTRPVGDIFLNLLFMAIIPLVFASLAVGVTRLGGGSHVGRVGAKTLAYFLVTTAFAAAIGLSLVNAVRPGDRVPPEQKQQLLDKYREQAGEAEKKATFGINTFVNIVPRNPLEAFVKKDMLAVIFSALIVGIALSRIDPSKARLLTDLLEGVN